MGLLSMWLSPFLWFLRLDYSLNLVFVSSLFCSGFYGCFSSGFMEFHALLNLITSA